jgi:hypothetical protein
MTLLEAISTSDEDLQNKFDTYDVCAGKRIHKIYSYFLLKIASKF